MTTATPALPTLRSLPSRADASHSTESGAPLYRLSVEQYHALIETGVFMSGDPFELVEGLLLHKMTIDPPHTMSMWLVRKTIEPLLPSGCYYHSQFAITLTDGEPEPDGGIIRGNIADYATRHPGPAEIELVIEVSDTSLRRDRGIKLRSYARAGIAC